MIPHDNKESSSRVLCYRIEQLTIVPATANRLSIIDDSPRPEFSPRQRHTLKEFAVSGRNRLSRPTGNFVQG